MMKPMIRPIHGLLGLLLVVLLVTLAGCGLSKTPILGGTEPPEKIIEAINGNFEKDAQFAAMISENTYPVWRSSKDTELRFEDCLQSNTGIQLDVLYNKKAYDDNGAGLLKRLLKTVADGDADKAIAALDLDGQTTKVAEYGDYQVVKVDVEHLRVNGDKPDTYQLPVMAVYIYHKNDDKESTIVGGQSTEDEFEHLTRSNDELKDAYDYWDTFFNPNNEKQKPSLQDCVKFFN